MITSRRTQGTHSQGPLRIIGWLFGLVIALLCVAFLLFPGWSVSRELSTVPVVAHAVAFARISGIALLVFSTLFFLVKVLYRARPARRFEVLPTLTLLLWAFSGGWLIAFPQGLAEHASSLVGSGEKRTVGLVGKHLKVVGYNSQDTLSATDLRELDEKFRADIYVFPEGGVDHVNAAVAGSGVTGQIFSPRDDGFGSVYNETIAPTTVLVRPSAGTWIQQKVSPLSFGAVGLRSADAGGVRLVGVHTAPPVPGLMGAWRDDLRTVRAEASSAQEPILLVGDFNATLRHGAMADLSGIDDAASAMGKVEGTWPVGMSPVLSAPIDHVLVSDSIDVVDFQTVRVGDGDHRAVYAELVISSTR